MNKKAGIMESNVGKAVLALILLVAILFIVFLATGTLQKIIASLKGLI